MEPQLITGHDTGNAGVVLLAAALDKDMDRIWRIHHLWNDLP